jgi:hypothetical protein
MYTIFSVVLSQQSKSDVMTYFGHPVYYKAGSLEEFIFQVRHAPK